MSARNKIADRYDRILSSTPVNADAARAFSMKGETEPDFVAPDHVDHWDAPPKVSPPPAGTAHRVGKKYGAITVIGYLRSRDDRSQWLVRCVCGRYEVRGGKAVERAYPGDQCQRCNKLRKIQRQAYFDSYGRWPDDPHKPGSSP